MDRSSFIQTEYVALRVEVDAIVAELRSLEKQTLFAVAAALAWLATQPLQGAFRVAWFAPFLLVAFASFRTWSIRRHQGRLSAYIVHIERAAQSNDPHLGWEHFQNRLDPTRAASMLNGGLGRVTTLYWAGLASATLILGSLGFVAQTNS